MTDELRLFPLQSVLFPGGRMVLRIFEQRYLDLVTHCLRQDVGFGACLIRTGSEVGEPAQPHAVGTEARIIDWEQRRDGLLGITVAGARRFEILERRTPGRGVQEASVRWLPEAEPSALDEAMEPLALLLERILDQMDPPYGTMPRHLDDAGWVSGRLAELLPLPLEARQQLLEIDEPAERLELLRRALASGSGAE